MADSLLAVAYFALLIGVCYGIGRFVVRFAGFWERFVFAVPIGMGVLSLVLLALGVGRLFLAPVFYTILALGIPGWYFLVTDAKSTEKTSPLLSKKGGAVDSPLLNLAFNTVFAVLALCTLIAALAPPGGGEWDALSYHLTVPKTYLAAGRIFYIPYDHHSNFPFLLQMLYSLMLGVGSVGGAKLCHWFCGVLLALSVYIFARRHHDGNAGHRVGQIAALLIAASPIVLWEAGIAYVDLATALFTWLSVAVLLMEPRRYILSALLMGFAIGTKWTVLGFWGIVLAGIVANGIVQEKRLSADLIKRAALWGTVSLLLAAPWLLRSYLYTGSPVYPYFYAIFGGHYWSAENAAQYSADQATLGLGKQPLFLLLSPWLINVLPPEKTPTTETWRFNEYPFGFAFALVPLLLAAPFTAKKFGRSSVTLALFAVIGYGFWFFLVQGTRYLLPILPFVALLAAETLVSLWDTGKGVARYAGAATVAATGIWGMYLASVAFTTPAVRVVLGSQSRSEYVATTQWMDTLLPASEFINANAPRNAKVALFDVVFGYYIDRPILWANPNHVANLVPWNEYQGMEDWTADFKRRGYTYFVTDEAFAPAPDSPLQQQAWRTWLPEAVAAGKVEVVFEKANVRGQVCRVYRVL